MGHHPKLWFQVVLILLKAIFWLFKKNKFRGLLVFHCPQSKKNLVSRDSIKVSGVGHYPKVWFQVVLILLKAIFWRFFKKSSLGKGSFEKEKKSCEISQQGGGVRTKSWYFHNFLFFFLTCSKSCKYAKKSFWWRGVPPSRPIEVRKSPEFWTNSCIFLSILRFSRGNFLPITKNIFQVIKEKNKFSVFHNFLGGRGGQDRGCENSQLFFSFSNEPFP